MIFYWRQKEKTPAGGAVVRIGQPEPFRSPDHPANP